MGSECVLQNSLPNSPALFIINEAAPHIKCRPDWCDLCLYVKYFWYNHRLVKFLHQLNPRRCSKNSNIGVEKSHHISHLMWMWEERSIQQATSHGKLPNLSSKQAYCFFYRFLEYILLFPIFVLSEESHTTPCMYNLNLNDICFSGWLLATKVEICV